MYSFRLNTLVTLQFFLSFMRALCDGVSKQIKFIHSMGVAAVLSYSDIGAVV